MSLTAAAEAYVAKPSPVLAWVLTISPPGGTVERFAEVDIGSDARGTFAGRITSVSEVRIGYGDYQSGVEALEVRVHVDDLDRALARRLEGASGAAFYGAPVSLELASPHLTAGAGIGLGDWPPIFVGMFDHHERSRAGGYDLVLRTDDREIQRAINLPVLSAQFVPFAVQPTIGSMCPIVYGLQDSRALVGTVAGTTGSIPCLFLGDYNGTSYRYLVSLGQMFHVERLFKDGVFQSPGTWSKEVVDLGPGLYVTCVFFATSMGNSRITVDGIGMHPDFAAAAQSPYKSAPSILRHLLNNFVFRAWRGGDRDAGWFGDSPRLDVASWDAAEVYAVRQDLRASLYLTPADSKTRAIDLLGEFARDHGFRLYWTEQNKLAIALRDNAETAIYQTGSRWIDAGRLADPAAVGRPRPSRSDVDGIRRELWRMPEAAASTTGGSLEIGEGISRARATILRPGSPGLTLDDHQSRLGLAVRYADRNMLAPASIRLAGPAFGLGQFGNAAGLKDGAQVTFWNGHYNGFNPLYSFNGSGGGPTLKLGRVNGRAAGSFDGVNDLLQSPWQNNSYFSSFAEWSVVVVFRIRACATNNANIFDNVGIFSDHEAASGTGGFFGMAVKNPAPGVYQLIGYAFDGGYKTTPAVAINLNQWYVARLRLEGALLRLAVNDSLTEVTASCGAMTGNWSLALMHFGRNPIVSGVNGWFDGDIAEMLLFSQGDVSGSALWPWAASGGGLACEIMDHLAREYGIA